MLAPVFFLSFALPWTVATPVKSPLPALQGAFAPCYQDVETNDAQDEEKISLLNRYAPVVMLSIEEEYYPSSIEYMLEHFDYIERNDSQKIPANRTQITPSQLDQIPYLGLGSYLSISEGHNPQPILLDPDASYLYGPAGQDGGMQRRDNGRGVVAEPVYGFWVDQGRGVVDLWYWTFYPYNLGKSVRMFGHLGNHVSDWEHIRLRTINGDAVSADFASHAGGIFSAGTIRWTDVAKVDDRPIAYSAAGSHGLWPNAGDHVYADFRLFRLVDVTDDDGAVWDTKGHVVPVQYWTDPRRRRKVWHKGEDAWLNFRGKWGNKGEYDCWWHSMIGICQLVDAPPGPNRWFGGPPDCTIAPLAEDTSTFSFYFSNPVVVYAEAHGVSQVQVEQICANPRRSGDDHRERMMDYTHDNSHRREWKIWSVGGVDAFRGPEQHKVTTPACKGRLSVVKSYKVSLCLQNGQCISTSGERKICSFEEGKKGYRQGNAVTVDDLDDWRWYYNETTRAG